MTVVDSHKGPVRWHVEIKGRAAHSSMAPLGVNAIAVAGKLLRELSRHRARVEAAPAGSALRSALRHAAGDAHRRRHGDQHRAGRRAASTSTCAPFPASTSPPSTGASAPSPPTSACPRCAGGARGGASTSPSPIRCRRSRPAPHSEVVALALISPGRTRRTPSPTPPRPGCFRRPARPSVVIGPGDIAQAHTADEWIAAKQIDKCMHFWRGSATGPSTEQRDVVKSSITSSSSRSRATAGNFRRAADFISRIGLSRKEIGRQLHVAGTHSRPRSRLALLGSVATARADTNESDDQMAFNNACRTCHSIKEGDNRLGPSLHGVVGRKAGSLEGFAFSSAMKSAGIVWDERHSTSSSPIPSRSCTATT